MPTPAFIEFPFPTRLENLAPPADYNHAATKSYVDSLVSHPPVDVCIKLRDGTVMTLTTAPVR
jgi:hypothetical protein